jgi:transposase
MPRNRVSMKKIREVLRLKWDLGLGDRDVALSCKISKGTVTNYLQRAQKAGLSWPLDEALDDTQLESLLFKPAKVSDSDERSRPDWELVHREKQRKGVTLFLLWQEYKMQNPSGYEYSTFTIHYRQWKKAQGLSMRQTHHAGEKLFVDYAGMTIDITDPGSGKITAAQVFVAVLGASNYTYAEVSPTQTIEDWLGSHQRALAFFGGAPQIIVPDNLKSGVKSPCYYEPELNPAYAELARHYGLAVIPARVRKPKDKAKAEVGVQIVERQVLAPLRERTFFSVREANEALWQWLAKLNDKPFQKLAGTRKEWFTDIDKPALQALPTSSFVIANWKQARVNIDYHVELEGHYYSVPYSYAKAQVELRFTSHTVEVFHHNKRIASHQRAPSQLNHRGRHTTIKAHMPKAHQRHGEWTPQRLIHWAQKTGESTAQVIEKILESRPHPEQGYRSCLGIMRLGKSYGSERLEAACRRANYLQSYSYKSIQSILKHKLDAEPLPSDEVEPTIPPQHHDNVRGASYYKETN